VAETASRHFDPALFDRVYRERILGNTFFEEPRYYELQKPRYRNTLRLLCTLPVPPRANILEIGGGQMLLLMSAMFGDTGTLGDIGSKYSEAVTKFGIRHTECDLLHDDLPDRDAYDLVVLCEVVEHLPVPLHLVLEKVARWIKPGGHLFITTPNLYRLRNVLRLLQGKEVFCYNFYPGRGQSIGHPFEFFDSHLKWQMEKAGFTGVQVRYEQLSHTGFSPAARLARFVARPLYALRPRFRDALVACGVRPRQGAVPSLAPAAMWPASAPA
jgi:SAM-dependent methyltransferase